MIQVGQILMLQGTLAQGQDVRYVWRFWDGSVHTTNQPFTQKVINKGGTLPYEMLAIDSEANVYSLTGSLTVNSPPLLTSVSLTDNDSPAPFATQLTSAWLDPDMAGNLVISVEDQEQTIPSPGISTFGLTVDRSKTVILSGTDTQGGVTNFPIDLRVAAAPLINATGTADPPVGRIGTGQTVRLAAFAEDQNGSAITELRWILETAGGWSADRTLLAPGDVALTDQGGGSFSALVDVSIEDELPGDKVVRLVVYTAQSNVEVQIPLRLVANLPPVVEGFSVTRISSGTSVGAIATDPDGDLMTFAWSFSQPSGVSRVGNPVSVVLATGTVIEGSVVVTDTFGGITSAEIPSIMLTSALAVTGVRGLAFTYVVTAMGYSPIIFAVSGLPSGLTFNGTVITGIPVAFGTVDVLLTASNVDGADVKTLRLTIVEYTPPPLPPIALKVNGKLDTEAPTYTAQDSLVVTYTLTNDLINLSAPGAVLELRTPSTGVIMATFETASNVQSVTLTPAQIQAAFSGLPTLRIRVYSVRALIRSDLYSEILVTRV